MRVGRVQVAMIHIIAMSQVRRVQFLKLKLSYLIKRLGGQLANDLNALHKPQPANLV